MPKKTKSVKKTDKAKAWNRKSKSTSYNIESIPINKIILIVCEGQTEKLYFESFPVLGLKVEAVDLKGQSKSKLVEITQEAESTKLYDEIWCVFDMDYKSGENEFSDFDNAITRAHQLNYKVAYSNDAFELWFYLHYNKIEAQQLRSFYYNYIGEKWSMNYEKEGKKYNFCLKIYQTLLDDKDACQKQAIVRAKELYESQKHLAFHLQNPVTMVYKLVELLNENLKR